MISDVEIGKRIRTLRDRRGITQTALGRAIGYTSHVPIVKIEAGRQSISVTELDRIAHILKVPLHHLIPGFDAGQPYSSLSVALRANSTLTHKEQDEILSYCKLKREERQKAKESMLGLSLRTPEGARALARRHLRDAGIAKPPTDLNYLLFSWDIGYDERNLGDRVSGFLVRDGMLRVICVNSIDTAFRKRMTTAHELGHFHLDTVEFDCTVAVGEREESAEELAFQYAHELLIPSDWLKENIGRWQRNPVGVALGCQVSPIACEMWARSLGLALPIEPELRTRHDEIIGQWEQNKTDGRIPLGKNGIMRQKGGIK